jgi:hypothetical protein
MMTTGEFTRGADTGVVRFWDAADGSLAGDRVSFGAAAAGGAAGDTVRDGAGAGCRTDAGVFVTTWTAGEEFLGVVAAALEL